ncbi:tumor necrosis factor ligand superfamily member 10 [Mytilus galloprovincialis]|nr:tumor necrosis factor ligand superfamily member 10 [Mytilus galloprovincialis]
MFTSLDNLRQDLYNEKLERGNRENTICVACYDLILGPLNEDNVKLHLLKRNTENGTEFCCAKGWNQTSILVSLLMFERQERLKKSQDRILSESVCKCNSLSDARNITRPRRPSVHLTAGVQPITDGHEPPFTVGNWVSQGPTSHTNDIHVDDSRIFINTSGLYFLYSQIFFSDLYNDQAQSNRTHTFYHYVYRFNYIYPNDGQELLLKSVRTQCWAKNKIYSDYTSYTAGVFRLNKGDQIFVKVSQIRLISRDRQASFFGVALMYP